MERIACIIGYRYIYWSDVIRVLASAAAVCTFLALYVRREKRAWAAPVCAAMAIGTSMVLSRLAYWYFRPEGYENLEQVLRIWEPGGMALMGAFAGCILTAMLLRAVRLETDLPDLLDCMCLSGGVGIALGRLACFFNDSGRGMIAVWNDGLPWVISGRNPVSGVMEYRLATFLIQAMVTGLLTVILLAVYLTRRKNHGDICLLFLLFYGASQVVLDSTRYDSLNLRSNGFINAVQLLGACLVVLAVVFCSVRLVQAGGWKKWHVPLWILMAACIVLAGYMEYHVQRHGNEAVMAYSVMSGALGVVLLSALVMYHAQKVEKSKHDQWLHQIGKKKKGR